MPDVLTADKNDINKEEIQAAILTATQAALTDFDEMRSREGTKLEMDILSRLSEIEGYAGIC